MRPPYARLTALVLLFSASGLAAQDLTPRTFPIKSVESWSYRSPSMEQTYDISVGLPPGYAANPTRSWPALVVTDGNQAFPVAFDAARGLADQGDIEGLIVISVGTRMEEGDSTWVRRRIYEFSPPGWDRKTSSASESRRPARCTGRRLTGVPAERRRSSTSS